MNNNYILMSIMFMFILLGWIMPYLNTEFDHDSSIVEGTDLYNEVSQTPTESQTSIFSVFTSILGMFFWTFGTLPIVVDLIFIPLRIILYVIVYDKFRGMN